MNQELILYPAMAMALLTLGIGMLLLRARLLAVRSGDLNPTYFQYNRGAKLPDILIRVEQNYSNLFELPLLFYALIGLLYTSQSAGYIQLGLLWGFVLSRFVHSLVHIRLNHLLWRRDSFITGFILLLASWILLGIQLLQGG
jgi:hypothetical protein